MIGALDRSVLLRDQPEQKLRGGDVGTVVMVYRDGEAFEVEFLTLGGDTHALATLPATTPARPRTAQSPMRASWHEWRAEASHGPVRPDRQLRRAPHRRP